MISAGTVPLLLAGLMAQDPGRPRLTWYGPGGERVEFSAKVLGNWVSKTANLLVEELDAEPGTTVRLALPVHWRTVVWALATWSVGGHVLVGDPRPSDEILVSADPALLAATPPGTHAVGVALPALATAFGPDLPAGAVDSGVEVRLQPDAFVPLQPPEPDGVALTLPDGTETTHGMLLDTARAAAKVQLPPEPRLLTSAGPQDVVASWLGPLAAGGSLVLHHALPLLDAAVLHSLQTQEGVTATR